MSQYKRSTFKRRPQKYFPPHKDPETTPNYLTLKLAELLRTATPPASLLNPYEESLAEEVDTE